MAISHLSLYPGKVIYTVHGFVDKNRDAQQDVFFDLMSKSQNKFIADLTRFQVCYGCVLSVMSKICCFNYYLLSLTS